MLSRILLASILLMTIGLAGCAGDDYEPFEPEAPVQGEEPVEHEDHEMHNETEQPVENVTNAAPVASLVASAINGSAPLNVTFTLNGTDADGDNLTWNLTINGEEVDFGSSLPATFQYIFQAGNHTVNLTVMDGTTSNSTGLDISALDAAPSEVAAPEPIVIKGSLAAPVSTSAIGFGCLVVIISDGVDGDSHTVSQDVTGWAYTVTDELGANFWAYWYDEGLNTLEDGTAGTVPAGYDTVEVCVDVALPLEEYTLTITPPTA